MDNIHDSDTKRPNCKVLVTSALMFTSLKLYTFKLKRRLENQANSNFTKKLQKPVIVVATVITAIE